MGIKQDLKFAKGIKAEDRTDFKRIAGDLNDYYKVHRRPIEFWKREHFTKPVIKDYSISICTTCMNRLVDLKKTLPSNIKGDLDYNKVEFVLLDYNSTDGLGQWVKDNLMEYIESGVLNYYRTEEPKYYSMTHSRNIAFKLAKGEIVNNVDADNYTNKGFATYLNRMANEQPRKAAFAKSLQLTRGRLGFYKDEFINDLGGYDERLKGYGFDDHDLLFRSFELGFKMMHYGGTFANGVPKKDSLHHQEDNYSKKTRWWWTEGRNKILTYTNLIVGEYKANEGTHWGKAKLIKNFKEEVEC